VLDFGRAALGYLGMTVKSWLQILTASAVLSGCGGVDVGDYCVEERECEALNEADEEACGTAFDAGRQIAEIYNCNAQWEALTECTVAESSCEGTGDDKRYTTIDYSDENDPDDSCGNERENLDDCLDGASDRDNNNSDGDGN
jgi:hypothetical protein